MQSAMQKMMCQELITACRRGEEVHLFRHNDVSGRICDQTDFDLGLIVDGFKNVRKCW